MPLKLLAFSYFIGLAASASPDRQGKIIGGNEATPHDFPHIVSLDIGKTHDQHNHICGGAILNEYWIITAAHCKWFVPDGQTLRIKAGKHSLSTVEPHEQVINVEKIFIHENYPGGKRVGPNDIALLKLEEPLILDDKYVKTIALPEKDREFIGEVMFSGWGNKEYQDRVDKLLEVNFTIIDLDTCRKAEIEISGPPSRLADTNLCTSSTGAAPYGVYACPGDSGSPLIKREAGKKLLVGVFSWLHGPFCGLTGAPSMFTKVSLYIDWIRDVMDNNKN